MKRLIFIIKMLVFISAYQFYKQIFFLTVNDGVTLCILHNVFVGHVVFVTLYCTFILCWDAEIISLKVMYGLGYIVCLDPVCRLCVALSSPWRP